MTNSLQNSMDRSQDGNELRLFLKKLLLLLGLVVFLVIGSYFSTREPWEWVSGPSERHFYICTEQGLPIKHASFSVLNKSRVPPSLCTDKFNESSRMLSDKKGNLVVNVSSYMHGGWCWRLFGFFQINPPHDPELGDYAISAAGYETRSCLVNGKVVCFPLFCTIVE